MDDRNSSRNEIKSQSSKGMRSDRNHSFTIEDRHKMVLSGVLNVERFNELEIALETELGILTIKGSSLHVSKLNIESGDLLIDGNIDSCIYSEKQDIKAKGSGLLSKLFK